MLDTKNIYLNQEFKSKTQCLDHLKKLFSRADIPTEYIDSIDQRQKLASFNIGSKIAIPHGTYEAMQYLKKSLIIVIHLKNPVIW
ncbi:PTS system mannitol-specific transporter subunit IIA, partial [Mycoplasma putrefaciens]